jgi:sialate O-acetylesterase
VREAQRRTALSTAKTGLIVTIDIGEAHDIHPKNKLDLGKRMARWALADVYGRKAVASGPILHSAKIVGSRMVLTFADVGQGLKIRDGDGSKSSPLPGGQEVVLGRSTDRW